MKSGLVFRLLLKVLLQTVTKIEIELAYACWFKAAAHRLYLYYICILFDQHRILTNSESMYAIKRFNLEIHISGLIWDTENPSNMGLMFFHSYNWLKVKVNVTILSHSHLLTLKIKQPVIFNQQKSV